MTSLDCLISVIIPTYNEEKTIATCLNSLTGQKNIEILVCDGNSEDQTVKIASNYLNVRVLQSVRGRAEQMNVGARAAKGEIYWFLHADTQVPDCAADKIRTLFSKSQGIKPPISCGAFSFSLSGTKMAYRIIEWGVNLRSKYFLTPYGDQGLFVKSDTFFNVGEFPLVPLLEDLLFVRKVKQFGRIAILDATLKISPRKWEKRGTLQTTLQNWLIIILHWSGFSPSLLNKVFSIPLIPRSRA